LPVEEERGKRRAAERGRRQARVFLKGRPENEEGTNGIKKKKKKKNKFGMKKAIEIGSVERRSGWTNCQRKLNGKGKFDETRVQWKKREHVGGSLTVRRGINELWNWLTKDALATGGKRVDNKFTWQILALWTGI